LDIFKNSNDSVGIANCYISLGHIYRRLNQRNEEIKYHKASFEIFSRMEIPERTGVASHNLGESYYYTRNLKKARTLTKLSITINDSIKNLSVLSSCYKVMGLIELEEKNLEEAEKNFKQVLDIADALGENSQKIAAVEAMLGLAKVYRIQKKYENQRLYLMQASDFSRKYELAEFLQASLQGLIEFHTKNGNNESASIYLQSFRIISDSIENKQLQDRYNLTKSVVEVHELTGEKSRLEKKNLVQSQQLQTWSTLSITISVLFLIVLLFFLTFLRFNYRLKASKKVIERQNKELEVLNSTKDKFFGIVAHDLKSPLISLYTFSGMLIDHYDELTREQITEMSAELKTSADNSIKMAENLITWAQLQMKEYNYKQENLLINELTSTIIDIYSDVATQKGIFFSAEVAEDLIIQGDKNQIQLIIRNLLNNAIKFTKPDGTVWLKAFKEEDEAIIEVSDTGVGMSREMIDNLFKLEKSSSTEGTSGEKGTGLGLMLILEFLKLNGGSMDIESGLGKGTIFKVKLKKGLPRFEK